MRDEVTLKSFGPCHGGLVGLNICGSDGGGSVVGAIAGIISGVFGVHVG